MSCSLNSLKGVVWGLYGAPYARAHFGILGICGATHGVSGSFRKLQRPLHGMPPTYLQIYDGSSYRDSQAGTPNLLGTPIKGRILFPQGISPPAVALETETSHNMHAGKPLTNPPHRARNRARGAPSLNQKHGSPQTEDSGLRRVKEDRKNNDNYSKR